ncbi:hypothetical protein [Enterococcus gilvus]|uniref:hypothetical protein n=1 Tax=Enterococcus gilvus TaxID=160453 RepID=UPI001C8B57A7|nr:hypothetical protein [Enterococcus gilvus]MBX8935576.1 hypothetical protein [Enterococcus gilvus]
MHRSIFSASFDESKNIVDKEILKPSGTGIGDASSLKLKDRIIIFLLFTFFFEGLSYSIGIAMPESMLDSNPSDIFLISFKSAILIGKIGIFLRPVVMFGILISFLILTINLIPKKNYAHQLIIGSLIVISMLFCVIFATLPMIIGLTIDGTGLLGVVFQIAICVVVIRNFISDRRKEFKEKIWGYKDTSNKPKSFINVNLKKALSIAVFLIIINRYLFHIGEGNIGQPGFFGLVYGWTMLAIIAFFAFLFHIVSPQFLSIFYFVKYGEQYREYFEISDEQWYGKRKAKRLGKRRKKNLE